MMCLQRLLGFGRTKAEADVSKKLHQLGDSLSRTRAALKAENARLRSRSAKARDEQHDQPVFIGPKLVNGSGG